MVDQFQKEFGYNDRPYERGGKAAESTSTMQARCKLSSSRVVYIQEE